MAENCPSAHHCGSNIIIDHLIAIRETPLYYHLHRKVLQVQIKAQVGCGRLEANVHALAENPFNRSLNQAMTDPPLT